MRIHYVGLAGRRKVRDYQFTAENGFALDVDAATAAELLTYPRRDFIIDRDEPLAAVFEGDGDYSVYAAALALEGIGGIAELAGIDQTQVAPIAAAAGVSVETVNQWATKAREVVQARAFAQQESAQPADLVEPKSGEEE